MKEYSLIAGTKRRLIRLNQLSLKLRNFHSARSFMKLRFFFQVFY